MEGVEDVSKIMSMLEGEGRQDSLLYDPSMSKSKEHDSGVEHKGLDSSLGRVLSPSSLCEDDGAHLMKEDVIQALEEDKKKKRKSFSRRESMESPSHSHSSNDNEAFWQERFNDLEEFQKQSGHCNPSYVHNSQLYSWLHRQKFLHRKGKLSEERIEKLKSIGAQLDYHWDEMLNMLKEYKEKNGTFFVDGETDSKLQYWVFSQVHAWNKGKLSQERIQKLESLGLHKDMESELPRTPSRRKKRRKSDVSMDSMSGEGGTPSMSSSMMVESVDGVDTVDAVVEAVDPSHEASFHLASGGTSTLMQSPLSSPNPGAMVGHSPSPKGNKMVRRKSEMNWLEMYKKLKEFRQENNTTIVPMKTDKKLGLWTRTQKRSWKEGKLAEWKQQKLMKLGIFKDDAPDLGVTLSHPHLPGHSPAMAMALPHLHNGDLHKDMSHLGMNMGMMDNEHLASGVVVAGHGDHMSSADVDLSGKEDHTTPLDPQHGLMQDLPMPVSMPQYLV